MVTTKTLKTTNRNNIEYYTTRPAVDLIIPYLPKDKVIWAPFSKDYHNYGYYLRSKGFKVITSHIDYGQDFLTYEPEENWDIILDNPPFKQKTKWVERALSFNKPFAILLPINALNDNGIPNLFLLQNKEMEWIIPNRRMEFVPNEKPNQNRVSFKSAYICYNMLPKQLIFNTYPSKVDLLEEAKALTLAKEEWLL